VEWSGERRGEGSGKGGRDRKEVRGKRGAGIKGLGEGMVE
jgi:hypothetical protein